MNPLFPAAHTVFTFLVLMAAAGIFSWLSTAKCRKAIRVPVTILRVLGLAGLAVIALNPGRWQEDRQDREREWAVAVDRSASMATADVGGKTRWSEAGRLTEKAVRLAGDAESVRLYSFTRQLETLNAPSLADLQPDGKSTDILRSLKMLMEGSLSAGKRLHGIILLTDGRQIEPQGPQELGLLARSQEVPIFPLPLGGKIEQKDLSVTVTRKQYITFAGQKVSISAAVENQGLGNIRPIVQLLNASNAPLQKVQVNLAENSRETVSFDVVPTAPGYYEYHVQSQAWEGETRLRNNEDTFSLAVLSRKMRVCLLEGTPYWDSKFLAQFLRRQTNMEVTSVYRLSQDRFFLVETDKARTSEASESLFLDQPETLAAYDMVVIGKGAEYFLTPERIQHLRSFIRDQGGSLLFARGKPYHGTFPELETLEPVTWGEALDTEFRLVPTPAGESMELFGETLPGARDPVWMELPPIPSANRCTQVKAFSQVLAEGILESGGQRQTFPAIISRRYGKGIVLTINADGLWQWDFFPSDSGASKIYEEMWAQLFQWVAAYSEFLPGHEISLHLSGRSVFPGEPVHVRVGRRGTAEDPASTNTMSLRVVQDQTAVQFPGMVRGESGENRWDSVFSLNEPGLYRVELRPEDKSPEKPVCVLLEVRAPPSEKDNVSADRKFLEALAEASGGRILSEDDLPALLRQVQPEEKTVDMSKATWESSWDTAWFLGFLLLLLGSEWFLRRRNGLM